MSEQQKVISPSEYRKQQFCEQLVTAPSGAVFKIRKLSPIDFIKNGMNDIPSPFLEFIKEGKDDPDKFTELLKEENEISNVFEKFIKISIEKGLVEPPVMLEYDQEKEDTHLCWSEISSEDQSFLLSIITGAELKKV